MSRIYWAERVEGLCVVLLLNVCKLYNTSSHTVKWMPILAFGFHIHLWMYVYVCYLYIYMHVSVSVYTCAYWQVQVASSDRVERVVCLCACMLVCLSAQPWLAQRPAGNQCRAEHSRAQQQSTRAEQSCWHQRPSNPLLHFHHHRPALDLARTFLI